MNPELIQEISQAISNQLLWKSWQFYLIIILLSLISGAFGAYFGAYFRKRGENFATKTDFDNLLFQLQRQTKITEETKLIVQRSEDTKTKAATHIMNLMAEIQALFAYWKVLVYFRKDTLKTDETIEDLGRKDLRIAVEKILELSKLNYQYDIYLSEELNSLISQWVLQAYELISKSESLYNVSKQFHQGKGTPDSEKLRMILDLSKETTEPCQEKLSAIKKEINDVLIKELKLESPLYQK